MNSMSRPIFFAIMLVFVVAGARPTPGWASTAAYERMAPLGQYLMDRQTEIDLARGAAPPAISSHATFLVLGRRGYETAEAGTNGFTCLVERSWMSPFDSPEFWNWKMRGPICYNPAATRSILRYTLERSEMALSGVTKAQMLDRTKAAVADGRLPAPEPGSMSYMMSKHGDLGDGVGPWRSHRVVPEPETIFMIAVARWSDGTPAPPT
jgi:hypothetical protein